MEEDNRSLHPSHPFRQYQFHRISEANLTSCKRIIVDNERFDQIRGGNEEDSKSIRGRINLPSVNTRRTEIASISSDTAGTTAMGASIDGDDEIKNIPIVGNTILGMTPVDDETGNNYKVNSNNNNKNSTVSRSCTLSANQEATDSGNGDFHEYHQRQSRQNQPTVSCHQQDENPSWMEESQRLFHDYQRRFHRQSLTDQAKDLLDRASILARGKNNSKNDKDNSYSNSNSSNSISIALCAEALELCKTAIKDQEKALNRNDCIGGSYLVTGDIRLRKKHEGLVAKIHCLRAAVRFQEGLYEEALEDCEAAISIWNQQYGSGRGGRSCFGNNERKFSKTSNSENNESTCFSKQGPSPRARKLSHKHLYLLKGRILAAMGRHRDAVVWLTHPQNLPARTFRRSSALLETDAAMNRFLERHLLRYKGLTRQDGKAIRKENGFRTQDDNPIVVSPNLEASAPRIPTNKKVWPKLLHSIDRRLNEGMIGTFHATKEKSTNRSGERRSNSGSAIYHILRHGSVLFHHYENQDEDKVKKCAASANDLAHYD